MYQGVNDALQKQIQQLTQSINRMPVVPFTPEPTMNSVQEQVKSVPGITGAREYLKNMAASNSQILMDEGDNVFYLVRKDANGNPLPITVGRFTVEQEPAEDSPYISKQDFEAFKAELWQKLEKGAST